MALTGTMGEAGTFHRYITEHCAEHGVVCTFVMTQLAALGTVALGVEIRVHLPLDYDFLDALEHRFALGNR
jgi:hypothetical protein